MNVLRKRRADCESAGEREAVGTLPIGKVPATFWKAAGIRPTPASKVFLRLYQHSGRKCR